MKYSPLEKITRKQKHLHFRLMRATLTYSLSVAFQEYHLSNAYRIRATMDISYLEAEKISEELSEMLGTPIGTDEVLQKCDFYDEAIEHYQNYERIKKDIIGFVNVSEGDIDAFIKSVEYNHEENSLTNLYCFAAVGYTRSMAYACKFLNGDITQDELLQNMKILIPHNNMVMNSTARYYFVKTMFRAEREFQEVVNKRHLRKIKRQKACKENKK